MQSELPDLMNTEQVAEMLGLSVQYVRDLCAEGRLGCYKLGRDWLIPRASVEEYRRTRRPPGRPRKSSTGDNGGGHDDAGASDWQELI